MAAGQGAIAGVSAARVSPTGDDGGRQPQEWQPQLGFPFGIQVQGIVDGPRQATLDPLSRSREISDCRQVLASSDGRLKRTSG